MPNVIPLLVNLIIFNRELRLKDTGWMLRQSYHVMQEEEDVILAMDNLVGIATEDMDLREEETEEEEFILKIGVMMKNMELG